MTYIADAVQDLPSSSFGHASVKVMHKRPAAADDAIARIANAHNAPLERVREAFWNAWDTLQQDAKFPDYLMVLTERRVREALRHGDRTRH